MENNKEKNIIEYYNNESGQYSRKRYPEITNSFTQFLFKKRRDIVINNISSVIMGRKTLRLLDIACADGILTDNLDEKFTGVFTKLVGSDIAPKMIETAQKKYVNKKNISFFVRDDCPVENYDIALGLGYLTMANLKDEKEYLFNRLPIGGYYLCTFVSSKSSLVMFKLKNEHYISDYVTFKEYENILSSNFEILKTTPYGLFIPGLWKFPFVARRLQPLLEMVFAPVFPDLFHEKVYLLKRIV